MTDPIYCLVVDDKPLAIDILTDYVAKVPFLQLAGSSTNPLEALNWVGERRVELIFLDIQMPQLTGLQFMQALDRRAQVILTTAYTDYALAGFEHDVIDYLLKPIPFERFYQAVQKAQRRLRPASAEAPRPYLFVKTEHRMQRVDLAEVLYVEGLQNYVIIHTAGEKIIARQTINSLENSLPASVFVRVHKSFIVSLAHIHTVERSRIYMQTPSATSVVIPVGDAYRHAFYGRFKPLVAFIAPPCQASILSWSVSALVDCLVQLAAAIDKWVKAGQLPGFGVMSLSFRLCGILRNQ